MAERHSKLASATSGLSGKGKGSVFSGLPFALMGFALYSTHDVVIKYLGSFYTPIQIIFFSVLFSFPIATLFMLRNPRTGSLWPHHPVKMAIRMGAATLSGFCAFYAFSVLPLAQTYALLFLTPIMITLLSIPLLGEKVGLHRTASIIVGFVGVLIVLQPGAVSLNMGHLAGVISVFGAATNSLITRQIGQKEKISVMLLYPMIGNFVIMGAILPFIYQPMPLLHLGATALIAILGFVAMFCIVTAFKHSPAVMIAPMQYSQILWAALFGFLFFNENIHPYVIIGSVLIVGSGLYIVRREWLIARSYQPVLSDISARPDTGVRPRFAIAQSLIKSVKSMRKRRK